MKVDSAVNIADLGKLAHRRLPKFIFDMIEGGVEDELGVARNESALQRYQLFPRVLVDISRRDQATTLFGRAYASPFGISPTGTAPIYRRNGDELLAKAAVAANVPFILAGGSGASLEEIHAIAPEHGWYQLYGASDRAISADLIRRASDLGYKTLVVTIDTPVWPKRVRHLRNQITVPLKFTPGLLAKLAVAAVCRPTWMLEYLFHGGMPRFKNWAHYVPAGASNMEVADFFRRQSPSSQTWADIETFRRLWPGNLVIKGVLDPRDAVRLVELGADGITVSNHGGKIVDRAPAAIDALPAIKSAIGSRARVMMDGGIRRGSDIAVALCLGADFVFVGRATLYGVVAAGQRGAARALKILRDELDLTLGTIGCPRADELNPSFLFLDDHIC
jgi:(S)-mandelate dehydrogenase